MRLGSGDSEWAEIGPKADAAFDSPLPFQATPSLPDCYRGFSLLAMHMVRYTMTEGLRTSRVPVVQPQIDFSNTPEFRDFMKGLDNLESARSLIHGIFIDAHPKWLRIVELKIQTGFHNIWYDYCHEPQMGNQLYDFEDVPDQWKDICKHEGKLPVPFIVKVYIKAVTPHTLPWRRMIESYAARQPFFVSVAEAPIPVFAASIQGGVGVDASGPGTLGGFLMDQAGRVWGSTCGHVAQNSNEKVRFPDAAGLYVPNGGTVRYSNFSDLKPSPDDGVCNQYVNPAHPSLDAALIELDGAHHGANTVYSVGEISEICNRTDFGSGSSIIMRGAVSRRNEYVIGGYGVTTRIELAETGEHFCFSHVFDFYHPGSSASWIPGRIAQAAAPRPLRGDSGAWLCSPAGRKFALFGTLIAVRGATGIATFADELLSWARNNYKLRLATY